MPSNPASPRPALPRLIQRWWAWVASIAVVTVVQVLMWNGWNASGEWISMSWRDALPTFALGALASALPVLVALIVLRRPAGLAVILLALLGLGIWTGNFLSTSRSSTAVFAFFGPLVYGIPFVGVVVTIDALATWLIDRDR